MQYSFFQERDKSMFSLNYWQIVEQARLFNLGKVTRQRQGKH